MYYFKSCSRYGVYRLNYWHCIRGGIA